MGSDSVHHEMTVDRLVARLAELEQENARLQREYARLSAALQAHLAAPGDGADRMLRLEQARPAGPRPPEATPSGEFGPP
jgi:hypothetical protein